MNLSFTAGHNDKCHVYYVKYFEEINLELTLTSNRVLVLPVRGNSNFSDYALYLSYKSHINFWRYIANNIVNIVVLV